MVKPVPSMMSAATTRGGSTMCSSALWSAVATGRIHASTMEPETIAACPVTATDVYRDPGAAPKSTVVLPVATNLQRLVDDVRAHEPDVAAGEGRERRRRDRHAGADDFPLLSEVREPLHDPAEGVEAQIQPGRGRR